MRDNGIGNPWPRLKKSNYTLPVASYSLRLDQGTSMRDDPEFCEHLWNVHSPKLTAKAPENECLEDEISSWGPAYF